MPVRLALAQYRCSKASPSLLLAEKLLDAETRYMRCRRNQFNPILHACSQERLERQKGSFPVPPVGLVPLGDRGGLLLGLGLRFLRHRDKCDVCIYASAECSS